MATEIFFVLFLVFANGLFSMSEMAIISSRRSRLEQQADEGSAGARKALLLSQDSTRFLSTVQIGITLIGILSGAVGGATVAEQLAQRFGQIPVLAPYRNALGVGIVVLIITYLSLVLGELVPKRLALGNPERIAARIAPAMARISRLTTPLVSLLTVSTEGVVRLLGVHPSDEPIVTEEEVKRMIFEGTRVGIFEEAEQDIMKRVFRLGDRRVSALMTYRSDVVWLDLDDSLEENLEKIQKYNYSRFPVCTESLDDVEGMLTVKDLLNRSLTGKPLDLRADLTPVLFVPEGMNGLEALSQFKQSKEETALVIDEYGGVVGMVTLKDLMEAIVGEMPTPEQAAEPEIIQREDGSWLLDGMLPFDDVSDLLSLREMPEEEEGAYETLGGFVMHQLGRIPLSGDRFAWDGFQFEVMDMDGHRVDKVLVQPEPPLEGETAANANS